VFQFEARRIFLLPEASYLKGRRIAHHWLCRNCLTFEEHDASRYAYRLTTKSIQVALLFLFFHKRVCGPLANSRFHQTYDPAHAPKSKLGAAYHKPIKLSRTSSTCSLSRDVTACYTFKC
jgi:hypothetical protein